MSVNANIIQSSTHALRDKFAGLLKTVHCTGVFSYIFMVIGLTGSVVKADLVNYTHMLAGAPG